MAAKDFHHPFTPYDIQQQFMEALYSCIENGRVGIFESPTGTGKSLSLICGSLTWLREHKRKTFDEAIAAVQLDDDDPEWMIEHAREARRKEARELRADFEARLEAVRTREREVRQKHSNGGPPIKKRKRDDEAKSGMDADESAFLLEDYDSDSEKHQSRPAKAEYSSETAQLMEKLGMVPAQQSGRTRDEGHDELKIYFCSRTHSQLSQFVGELKRVNLPSGLPPEPNEKDLNETLKHLTLGSRKTLCINPKVSSLGNQTAINERCVELQSSSTPAAQKCPFLPTPDSADVVLDFRDHALAQIGDIEDLATVGKKLGICPYYASRPAIGAAEIVTLPYPLLLQKSAREALGISLKGHVVIIDEAHNLINAVEGIYSTQIGEKQLDRARECLMVYLQKFRNRLKGSNRVYVSQVVRVIDSLRHFIAGCRSTKNASGSVRPDELLSGKGVDQINLAKLVRYINDSKLARKVEGYTAYLHSSALSTEKTAHSTSTPEVPTLTQFQNILQTLMNPSKEGQHFWARQNDEIVLQYLLLDPSEHFRGVADDARAVILAGGTMSPMDEYRRQLFPYISSIETLSCGHLIPTSNLLVRTIASDMDGPLDLSFKSRSHTDTAARLGHVLQDLKQLVPGGLIVFFPSYGFLEEVIGSWKSSTVFDQLHNTKPVFCDSRFGSAEDTFRAYSEAIKTDPMRGAILLSVIGGKLSEGINFSDDLGRCVVVIGLPFPNLETPEWKAKLQYIDQKASAWGQAKGGASREHAENICMRSVNQAIGRVIRHKNDWASILLLDSRYTQERIRGKLPAWIKASLPPAAAVSMHGILPDVEAFYRSKAF